jgi:hypothetical protein
MAINQVGFVSPKSEPQRQEKPKKTTMETILEGLQVANGVLGIGNNVQQIRSHQRDIEAKDWTAKGGLTKPQEADFRDPNKFTQAQEGEQGSFLAGYVKGQDGTDTPLVMKAKAPTQKVAGQYLKTQGPDGKPQYTWAEDGGPSRQAYVEPKDNSGAIDKRDNNLKSARERAQTKLNNDLQQLDTQIASADEVMQIAELAKTNPAAAGAIGLKLARAAGEKGVLSDADKRDYGGSQALQDKLARYIQRSTEGTLTQEDAAFAANFAETMRAASERARSQVTERNIQQFTRNYGGDFRENYGVITGSEWAGSPQAPVQEKAPPQKQGAGEAFAAPADSGDQRPAAALHPQAKAARAAATAILNNPKADAASKAKASEVLKRLGPEEEATAPTSSDVSNPLGNRYRGNRG